MLICTCNLSYHIKNKKLKLTVRAEMETMRSNISDLELKGIETLDLDEKQLILSQVENHREQLASCQRQFRQANVKAMTALETQSSKDLLKSSMDRNRANLRNRKDKEQMVSEHGSITQNLLSISRQLAETVEKSKQTVSNLEDSSRIVEEVNMPLSYYEAILLYISFSLYSGWRGTQNDGRCDRTVKKIDN